jgi:hypothetical protein
LKQTSLNYFILNSWNVTSIFFVALYLFLWLVLPLFQRILKNLNERRHLLLLFGLIINNSIILIIFNGTWAGVFGSGSLVTMCFFIGAYLKKYPKKTFNYNFLNACIAIFLLSFKILLCIKIKNYWESSYSDILAVVIGIYLFLLFRNLKFHCSTVNVIASTMFSVYLVQFLPVLPDMIIEISHNVYIHFQITQPSLQVIIITAFIFLFGIVIGFLYNMMFGNILKKYFGVKIDRFWHKVQVYLDDGENNVHN